MLDIHARWVIAGMHDDHSRRNFAMSKFESDPMGKVLAVRDFASQTNPTIATG